MADDKAQAAAAPAEQKPAEQKPAEPKKLVKLISRKYTELTVELENGTRVHFKDGRLEVDAKTAKAVKAVCKELKLKGIVEVADWPDDEDEE